MSLAPTCQQARSPDLQVEAELVLEGVGGLALQQLSQAEPAPLLRTP